MENGVTTATPAPQYAPHDPTLPEPWRALVDTSTGYIYYWNPHTNITQYERPIAAPPLPPGPPPVASAPKFVHVTTADPSLQNLSAPVHTQAAVQQGARSDSMPSVQQVARSDSMPTVHQGARSDSIYPNSSGLIPAQPKLASIPVSRNQQGIGEVHLSHASTGHHNNSIASGVQPNMLKHGASDHSSFSQDFKRPRLHGFSDLPNASDIESYKRQHEVSALGENVPAPFITFDAAGIPSEILRELQNAGFLSPTPIQAQSWPIALQGRDIVAIAKTGSGKTLGYLLPAFLHLRRHQINLHRGATVLVLAPTRELATQIQEEAVKFGRSSRITSTCIYGGAPKGPQLRDLERGADIIVATPGRLNDFLEVRKMNLQQVSFLVLDEADRMLDMGFEPQIRKIVNEIPSRRQTLMYTATWPKEVRKIASDLLVNPVQVNIGNIDELSANKSITQCVELVAASEKHRRLEQILRSQEPGSKILVFCSTKKMCNQLTRILSRQFGAAAIHGDKSQSERDWVLTQFRTGRSPVLIATDVAARGLDIKDIRIVINFDFPTGIEDYVHRIGRTGRAGATGLAYTFFSDHDAKYAQDLVKALEVAGQRVPPELREMAARSAYNRGRGERWDSGGHSGRVGGRGGRGDGGRGHSSGRGEFFGARDGEWGMRGGRVVRQDRVYDRFGGRGRFDRDASDRFETFPGKYDRHSRERHQKGGHSRYFDDGADRSRGSLQKFDERLRGRRYSRSYSMSPSSSRSRGRSYSRSRSRGRSYSRSRSLGRSYSRSRSRSQIYHRYDGKVVLHKGSSFTDVRSNSPSKIESMERHGLPVRNGPLPRRSAT